MQCKWYNQPKLEKHYYPLFLTPCKEIFLLPKRSLWFGMEVQLSFFYIDVCLQQFQDLVFVAPSSPPPFILFSMITLHIFTQNTCTIAFVVSKKSLGIYDCIGWIYISCVYGVAHNTSQLLWVVSSSNVHNIKTPKCLCAIMWMPCNTTTWSIGQNNNHVAFSLWLDPCFNSTSIIEENKFPRHGNDVQKNHEMVNTCQSHKSYKHEKQKCIWNNSIL